MRKQQQQNRRTFRGRGGPTDGRIRPPRIPRVRRKYEGDGGIDANHIIVVEPREDTEDAAAPRIVVPLEPNPTKVKATEAPGMEEQETPPLQSQLQHLQQRIRHNRTAMRQTTVAHLEHYQTHVLAATQNTLREWRSLLRKHHTSTPEQQQQQRLLDALQPQLFGLVQQALQTGPLAGAQPGYCKRCGSAVAHVVWEFLQSLLLLEDDDDAAYYPWTERQHASLTKWCRNAETAATTTAEQQPSKSIQKRMNKRSKNRKREKGDSRDASVS